MRNNSRRQTKLSYDFIQLKEMSEQLPPEVLEGEKFRNMVTEAENFLQQNSKSETSIIPSNLDSEQQSEAVSNKGSCKLNEQIIEENNNDSAAAVNSSQDIGNVIQESNPSSSSNTEATAAAPQSSENDLRSSHPSGSGREGEAQIIEQFEPGVYVTLVVKPSGIRSFKRVRFRYYNYLSIQQILFTFYLSLCHNTSTNICVRDFMKITYDVFIVVFNLFQLALQDNV